MNIPQNLLYSKEHEWVRIEGDKAYIGISDYAQHHLGDIVREAEETAVPNVQEVIRGVVGIDPIL